MLFSQSQLRVLLSFLLALGLSSNADAKNYKYSELAIHELDEMKQLVRDELEPAESEGQEEEDESGIKARLYQATKLIFSRPDTDNMRDKLWPSVRSELRNLNAYDTALAELTDEAIKAVGDKKLPAVYRATALIILHNQLSELKPDLKKSTAVQFLFGKIRDARIEVDGEVRRDMKLRSMLAAPHPSETAARLLKDFQKSKKAEAKNQKNKPPEVSVPTEQIE